MRLAQLATLTCTALAIGVAAGAEPAPVRETTVDVAGGPKITVRTQGPYDADVPLQVVCYFRRTAESDAKTKGAPVTLDERLGGVIKSLRERGEFAGDELETLLIRAPAGSIEPDRLLLIGLGDEGDVSLEKMERVGRTALREAALLGAERVAFAPLLRDQGSTALGVGEVERVVTRGVLLAYDTQTRLARDGLAEEYRLTEWVVEAGPAYFDETVAGVKKAVADAAANAKTRSAEP